METSDEGDRVRLLAAKLHRDFELDEDLTKPIDADEGCHRTWSCGGRLEPNGRDRRAPYSCNAVYDGRVRRSSTGSRRYLRALSSFARKLRFRPRRLASEVPIAQYCKRVVISRLGVT